jgi:hypothetical protein
MHGTKGMTRTRLWLSIVPTLLSPVPLKAAVAHDAAIPQLAFTARELRQALNESGRDDLQVALSVKPYAASPEAFEIPDLEVQKAGGSLQGPLRVRHQPGEEDRVLHRGKWQNRDRLLL